ncbi:MAG TPA: alpha/beta hydrolase [Thermoleophilia bacterium]|nr:alpha/beta hydrolase [Thermoleophilia bacterium]
MRRTLAAVELASGVRMPYMEQGDPAACAVLLVHAVGDSGRAFEALLAYLPDAIHAVAPTLRGHGDASRPESGYRSADFAGDLAAFMDALRIEAAVVVGASSGGQVALRLALDHPERILGLVLLGSPLRLSDKPGVREAWDATLSLLEDPIDPGFVRDFIESIVVQPVPEAVIETLVQESLKVPAFVWKATMSALLEDDLSPRIGDVAAPTLVVWGDQDAILPRSEQEALATGIRGARLLVYEGGGHAFYWEDAERVAADLVAFVGSLDAS